METNQEMMYLKEKIEEIGSAIFFNQSDSVLKLPTSIITKLTVDSYGYVWFYVQKPNENLQHFETEFPVRLDFFRKGKDCFIQVEGTGWVVDDPEEMSVLDTFTNEMQHAVKKDMVLVKVKILREDFHESKASQQASWWDTAVNTISAWFGSNNSYRTRSRYFPAS